MKLQPIHTVPSFKAAADKLAAFRAESTKIEHRIKALVAADYLDSPEGRGDDSSSIEAANRIIAGQFADVPDRPREVENLRHRLSILDRAIRAQTVKVEEMRGELSAEAAAACVPQHRAALADMLDAARGLAATVEAERAIRTKLNELGYASMDHILPPGGIAAGLMLGSESDQGSQISRFRDWLKALPR